MMSPKRLEEMKRRLDEILLPAGVVVRGHATAEWLAHALKDAIAEIEELESIVSKIGRRTKL